ncbi:uncharacterized protein LOC131304889 isoform X1 [Rhododendron vialii]|uniref:uncharacterized protein LOC131304889 isoform X1 n=1 Tax=Rhododendron vialii TaxID=182163 RepID=UPI0026604642|nr:uncharacterized protein LOC131304889 isoform X1 [Rhododendron vialii]
MPALSSSIVSVRIPRTDSLSGSSLMRVNQSLGSGKLFVSPTGLGKAKPLKYRKALTVQASRDDGGPSSASIFVGGFVLGGVLVGALGCIYAPQISKVLVGEQRKQLMRKLPKFIYDEEKALEKTRKILTAKIEQLNSAIDEVASQIHGDNTPKSTKSKRAPVRIKPEEEVEDTTDYYIV